MSSILAFKILLLCDALIWGALIHYTTRPGGNSRTGFFCLGMFVIHAFYLVSLY